MKTSTAKAAVKISKAKHQQTHDLAVIDAARRDPIVALALAGLPTLEELDRACAGFSNQDHIRAGDAHGVACDSAERTAENINKLDSGSPDALVRIKALHALASRHGLLRRMHYVLGGEI